MGKYDNILKEKKVYKDPEIKHSKFTKYVIIYLLFLILLLSISYLIYYNTILSPKNLILNNLKTIKNNTQNLLSNTTWEKNYEGTIQLDQNQYGISILNDQNTFNCKLTNQNDNLYLKLMPNKYSIEFSTLEKKQITKATPLNQINLGQRLTTYLNTTKYIKTISFNQTTPIVELNFTLTEKDINTILGSSLLKEKYNIIVTMKNNALTNQLISIKLSIANETSHLRSSLEYQNHKIIYKDVFNQNYRLLLNKKGQDFSIKIYKNDDLYSIFSKEQSTKETYNYTYQMINKVYTIHLNINKNQESYIYHLNSDIEIEGITDSKDLIITLKKEKKNLLEESNAKEINYATLSQEEKQEYEEKINNFLKPLKELYEEYKNNIN